MPDVRFRAGQQLPNGEVLQEDLILRGVPEGLPREEVLQRAAMMRNLDRKTGAPAKVRAVVGASPDQDRLANIKQFYPEAQAIGDDNFLFMDPKTKRGTLYNPPGLDMGDIPSVGREIAQGVAGAGGAALAAAPAAISGQPWASPALGALASQGAGQAYDQIMRNMGMIDTRTMPQRVAEVTSGAALEGVLGRYGSEVAPAMSRAYTATKRAFRGQPRSPNDVLQDFLDIQARPSAGMVSNSIPMRLLDRTTAGSFTGGGRMQASDDAVMEAVEREANRVASRFGTIYTPEGLGSALRYGAQKYSEALSNAANKKFEKVLSLINQNTSGLFMPTNTIRYFRQFQTDPLATELPKTSQRLKPKEISALGEDFMDDVMRRGQNGRFMDTRMSYETLKRMRSQVGKKLNDFTLLNDAERAEYKTLYAALSSDMDTIAKKAGPEAYKAQKQANEFWRRHMKKNVEPLERVIAKGTDQKLYDAAINTRDPEAMRLLRRTMPKDEWRAAVSTVISRLGMAPREMGGEFSPYRFYTNYKNLPDETKNIMFGHEKSTAMLRKDLDRLFRISEQLQLTGRASNFSNTARQEDVKRVLSSIGLLLGAGIAGEAAGGVGGAAMAVTGAAVAPAVAARLLTSPKFVNALASTAQAAQRSPNGIGENIGRFVAIAKAEPEMREEIYQFLQALRTPPDRQQEKPQRPAQR